MALVTGTLKDFGLDALAAYAPTIKFIPSGPGVNDTTLFASRVIEVVPAADGSFSVDLAPTEDVRPDRWYSISLGWLNGAGVPVGFDAIDWQLRVPIAGGTIPDLVNAPANPAQVWVSESAPANPTPGTWWLNPTTGDLNEWSN